MKVLVFLQREWAFLYGIPIVETIKKKYPDTKFAGYVYKIKTWNKIKKQYNYFDKLWLGYKFDDQILDLKIKDEIEKINISDLEKELEIDSVWKDIIHVDRNLIYTPGQKWRYSLKQQVSDENSLKIVKLNYLFIKNQIFNEFKPDIVILPNFGSIFHNVLYYYSKKRGVDCWMPIASKISNRVLLTNDKEYTLSNIFNNYSNFSPNKESLFFAKEYILEFNKNFIKPIHLRKINFKTQSLFKNFMKDSLKLPIRTIKNYYNNKNPLNPKVYRTLDNIKTLYFIKNFFSEYNNLYNLKKYKYDNLGNIADYIFMPLHVQPEVSTNLWAPLFTNQFEFIRQVAICLPGNLSLVVKEHPIMLGRRSCKYYDKLRKLPNVKVLSHTIETKDIIPHNKCKGIVVISGTAGFEAAILGKPVFIFSKTFYDHLNNVITINNFDEFIYKIKTIENLKYDNNETEKLISFLYENSFELSYSLAYSKKIDISNIRKAYLKKIDAIYNKLTTNN